MWALWLVFFISFLKAKRVMSKLLFPKKKGYVEFDLANSNLERGFPRSHVRKSEAEKFRITLRMVDDLPDGIFLSSLSVTATDVATGQDTTGTMISDVAVLADENSENTIASFYVAGGTAPRKYLVVLLATLDDAGASVIEKCIKLDVSKNFDNFESYIESV